MLVSKRGNGLQQGVEHSPCHHSIPQPPALALRIDALGSVAKIRKNLGGPRQWGTDAAGGARGGGWSERKSEESLLCGGTQTNDTLLRLGNHA